MFEQPGPDIKLGFMQEDHYIWEKQLVFAFSVQSFLYSRLSEKISLIEISLFFKEKIIRLLFKQFTA